MPTSNGLPLFDDTTPAAPLQSLLNAQSSALDSAIDTINGLIGDQADAIAHLITKLQTPPIYDSSPSYLTAATGWSFNTDVVVRTPFTVAVYINATRTGADINIGATGNIVNTVVANIAEVYAPKVSSPLTSSVTGKMHMGYINTTGDLTVSATIPNYGILNGEEISLTGMWSVAPTDLEAP